MARASIPAETAGPDALASAAARLSRPHFCGNCGRPIEQPKGRGRPRKFCERAACRQQARRRRSSLPWPPVPVPGYPADPGVVRQRTAEAIVALLSGEPPAPALDQLQQGLLECNWLAFHLAALERDLEPRLGGRAAELAGRIRGALRDLFPEVGEVLGGP